MLEGLKKAHFIGIGGVGMSGVAKLLKDTGVEVTGSDEDIYPPVSDFLEQAGLPCRTPYAAENIPPDVDLIVVGKNAKLVPETNREVKAAYESGKRIASFPEILHELSANKEAVVVAGSYGKSTSAALLAHILEVAGENPSYFIGALPYTPSTSAKMSAGTLFVLEGDEYPSSNTDPRAKFLHFRPAHLLITPLAHDHLNVFPTPAHYLQPFRDLISLLPMSGLLAISTAGALSKEFIASLSHPLVTYGVNEGEYHASNIKWGETTSFTIVHNETAITEVQTSLLGEHNVENIVGTAALLFSLNLVAPNVFREAVASFKGIRRRLDRKSEKTRIPIYEGFGSSYEKARSAIAAIKLHFPTRRLIVVFEPHTFSWRNRDALSWYDTVFEGAEKIFIYEPAAQGAETHKQLTQEEIIQRVEQAGFNVDPLEMADMELTENDVVLILTSGNLGGFMEPIVRMAEDKFHA